MPPQHGPLPNSSSQSTHVPLYTFYPPPRRSSLNPPPPTLQLPLPPLPPSPTSPRYHTPPLSPIFANSPRPDSLQNYSPQLSPSISIPGSPRWPSPTLKAAYIQDGSRSPTPSTPYSVNSTDPLPIMPMGSHLSITSSTGRNSSTPINSTPRGLSVYLERSAWEKDEDDGSQRKKAFGAKTVKLKNRRWWWIILAVVVTLITAGLGIGLGLGLKRKQENEDSARQALLQSENAASSAPIVATTASPTPAASSDTDLLGLTTIYNPTITSSSHTTTSSVSTTTSPSDPSSLSSSYFIYPFLPTTLPTPDFQEERLQMITTTLAISTTTVSSPAYTTPSCPKPAACNAAQCEGHNQMGMLGWCTAGPIAGCGCISICGTEMGKCSGRDCQGTYGFCEIGEWMGCPCEFD